MPKVEVFFIVFILSSFIIIPIFEAELFPYSSFALFTDSPRLFVDYEVFDNEGNKLKAIDFNLQRNYYGISPRKKYARIKDHSVDVFGKILSDDEVRDVVLNNWKKHFEKIHIHKKVFRVIDGRVSLDQTIKLEVVR